MKSINLRIFVYFYQFFNNLYRILTYVQLESIVLCQSGSGTFPFIVLVVYGQVSRLVKIKMYSYTSISHTLVGECTWTSYTNKMFMLRPLYTFTTSSIIHHQTLSPRRITSYPSFMATLSSPKEAALAPDVPAQKTQQPVQVTQFL